MSLLDILKKKLKKGGKLPSLRQLIHKQTGCPYRYIFIPDTHLDLVDDADAQEFLKQDRTDKETYVPERFDCDDFARNVYNNARNYGLFVKKENWAWAELTVPGSPGHALNLYVNKNQIVVFIETQTDEETTIHSRPRYVKF